MKEREKDMKYAYINNYTLLLFKEETANQATL